MYRSGGDLYRAYDDPSLPLCDLLALLWREGDTGGRLRDQLAAPVVFRCLEISQEHTEPVEVVRAAIWDPCFLTAYSSSHSHSLGAELALTAAVRALSRALEDPSLANLAHTTRFSAELLGAATGHLLWLGPDTNLVGLLGLVSRARTLREARRLGEDLAATARREVIESPPPNLPDAEAFARYVGPTAVRLQQDKHRPGAAGPPSIETPNLPARRRGPDLPVTTEKRTLNRHARIVLGPQDPPDTPDAVRREAYVLHNTNRRGPGGGAS